jgi:GcrA cell cycle regulator
LVESTPTWPDERRELLALWWAEGVTTAEIGRRLGCSKNSVIGRAHREDLELRPNAITGVIVRPDFRIKARKSPKQDDPQRPPGAWTEKAAHPVCLAPPPPPVVVVPVVRTAARVRQCCWPIGTPGTKTFRFCAATARRDPYCDAHRAIAYLPPRT